MIPSHSLTTFLSSGFHGVQGSCGWKRRRRSEMGGGKVAKVVTVENNPFQKLILQPWLEESKVVMSKNTFEENEEPCHGHKSYAFENENNASVVIHLGK